MVRHFRGSAGISVSPPPLPDQSLGERGGGGGGAGGAEGVSGGGGGWWGEREKHKRQSKMRRERVQTQRERAGPC